MRKKIRVLCVTLETEYLVMLGLFVAGLLFLAIGLTKADILLFDEGHYIGVARHHVDGEFINPSWGHDSTRPYNFEHPPLAKYVMALSIVYVGDNPVGWRIPSVIVRALGGLPGSWTDRRACHAESQCRPEPPSPGRAPPARQASTVFSRLWFLRAWVESTINRSVSEHLRLGKHP